MEINPRPCIPLYNTNQCVNSCIPEENSKLEYHQIDEVIQMALSLGILVKGAHIRWTDIYQL